MSRFSAIYRGFWMTIGVALAVALVLAVDQASSVLVLILIAAFLAVGLNPIVEFLIRRNIKRKWAVLVVAALVLGIIALVVSVIVGVLRNQIVSFFDDLPSLLSDLKKHKSIAHLDDKYHVITDLQKKLNDPDFAEKTFGGIFNAGLGVLNALASTLIVIILTLYFLAALPQIKRAMFSLAPTSRRERVTQLGDEILRRVGRYVIGAFLVALLAGTVTTLFLISVGLGQYALPLALAVALLDLIPLVGSITGAAIVCLVCLANSLGVGARRADLLPDLRDARGVRDLPAGHALERGCARVRHDRGRAARRRGRRRPRCIARAADRRRRPADRTRGLGAKTGRHVARRPSGSVRIRNSSASPLNSMCTAMPGVSRSLHRTSRQLINPSENVTGPSTGAGERRTS